MAISRLDYFTSFVMTVYNLFVTNTRIIGAKGEDIASSYLTSKGYRIIDRNFQTKLGELDIVAEKGEFIIFIEVKYRSNLSFGYPYEAVNSHKLFKLKKMVEVYMLVNKVKKQAKVEILSIWEENGETKIKHYTDLYF
ncbi:MAG: YraN family protein [Patescibacteria group bacterium]